MIRKFYSLLILGMLPLLSICQMQFEEGNWASVKAKAKKENKLIFIDFYTTWCAPCKQMAKNIFPLPGVGDFYNKHFVNYKVDAEKGEGPTLAQKYAVKAYPTYIFTDTEGNFLHQGVGSFPAEKFIEVGRQALDPDKRLSNMLNSEKEISKENMPAHLRKLSQERLPYNEKYEAYINALSEEELITKPTYELMVELGGRAAKGFTFDNIMKHKKAFAKIVGEKTVEGYFYNKYLSKAYSLSNKNESYESVLQEIKISGFDFAEKLDATITLTGYNYEGKHDQFLKEAPVYLKKFAENDPAQKHRTVFMEAVKFFHKTPEMKNYALQLADELIEADYRVSDVNAYLGKKYADAGDLATALDYYQKASQIGIEKGKENNYAQSVEFLQKRIAILEKGDYEFQIEGLEKYNGLSFKLFYYSDAEPGKFIETDGVGIVEGKCTVNGNVKIPMPGGWGIYDGDYMKTKGDIVLEPGTFKAKYNGDNLEVENGWYNYYIHQGLRDHPTFSESLKKFRTFNDNLKEGDLKDNPELRKEFGNLNKAINDAKDDYYKQVYNHNPDPTAKVLSFFVGNLWWKESGAEELEKLEAKLGEHFLIETIKHFKAESEKRKAMRKTVAVGQPIKPFTAKDLSGKEFELEKVLKKNKYVLVEFWASWCGPCRGAIPHLKEVHKTYHKKGFEIVSFSLDHKRNMWQKASEEENIPWINTSDLQGRKSPIAQMYGVSGIPDNFLVDKNGIIIGRNLREKGLNELMEKVFK